jgi:flap endonuclease-1
MGINGLSQYIKSLYDKYEDKNDVCYEEEIVLKKTKPILSIGVDFMLWYYRRVIKCAESVLWKFPEFDNDDIENSEIFIKSMYDEFICVNIFLMENNINPVWFFDGKNKEHKKDTHAKRKENKIKKEDAIKELENEFSDCIFKNEDNKKKLIKMKSQNFFPSQKFIKKFIANSKSLGVSTINCEGEAEIYAAALSNNELLFGVLSDDTDIFPSGAYSKIILKDKKIYITFVEDIYKKLFEFENLEQFRNFCVLLGTDFNDRIFNVGPVKCHKIIKKYKTIKNFLESEEKDEFYEIKNSEDEKVKESFACFKNKYEKAIELLTPVKIEDFSNLTINPYPLNKEKEEKIKKILKENHIDEYSQDTYIKILANFMERFENKKL